MAEFAYSTFSEKYFRFYGDKKGTKMIVTQVISYYQYSEDGLS